MSKLIHLLIYTNSEMDFHTSISLIWLESLKKGYYEVKLLPKQIFQYLFLGFVLKKFLFRNSNYAN